MLTEHGEIFHIKVQMVNHNRKVVIVKEVVQGIVRDFGSVGGVDVVIHMKIVSTALSTASNSAAVQLLMGRNNTVEASACRGVA